MDPMITNVPRTSASCPLRDILDLMGERWSMLVVLTLGRSGPLRFTALKAQIPDVSHRLLTQSLRQLERSGLVSRTVHATAQLRVDYALTTLGRSFLGPLMGLVEWAAHHHGGVLEARAAYRVEAEEQSVPSQAACLP